MSRVKSLKGFKLHLFQRSGISYALVNYFMIDFCRILSSNAITYLPKEVFLSLKSLREL